MKKSARLFAMMLAIVLLLQCSTLAAANNTATEAQHSIVTFLSTSENYNEMEGKADLVIYGTVVDQWTQVRGSSLVVTVSEVSIDTRYLGSETAAQIEIVQTGGTNGTHSTAVPGNAPLLEEGEQYYLYLRYSPADGLYDAYYLILGGGQGNIPGTEVNTARSNSAVSWAQLRESAESRFNRRGTALITDGPVYWPRTKGTVTYYIEDTFTYEGHSVALPISFMTKVRTGFNVWNGLAGISYAESFVSGDVTVICDYLGDLDWDAGVEARVNWYADVDSGQLVFAYAYFNFSRCAMDDSTWDNIIPHEAGHGLGLAHDATGTIMQKQSNGRPQTPTSTDIAELRSAYGNP